MIDPSYEAELKERNLRRKQWNALVSAAVAEVEDAYLKRHPGFHHTTFFGAMGIDPKHLAIWCFFTKDEDLKRAEKEHFTGAIQNAMREALKKHGYPSSLVPSFFVRSTTRARADKLLFELRVVGPATLDLLLLPRFPGPQGLRDPALHCQTGAPASAARRGPRFSARAWRGTARPSARSARAGGS